MKVLIVDDHALVRAGLRQVLLSESPKYQIGEAQDRASAVAKLRAEAWDVVILDINLPGRNGIEILKEIKHGMPNLPVLILSMHSEDEYALRAMRAGAAGYLTKDVAADLLVEALEKVTNGGRYITPRVAEKLLDGIHREPDKSAHETLSDREFEVLRSIAKGLTVTQIASAMNLSVKTISTYRARLLKKLGAQSNLEIMRYAMDHKLVDS